MLFYYYKLYNYQNNKFNIKIKKKYFLFIQIVIIFFLNYHVIYNI